MHGTSLSTRLRDARTCAGLTRAELARRLGVDRGTVMRAEDGKNEPRPATLAAWARVCGVSADSLLGLDGSPTPVMPCHAGEGRKPTNVEVAR
jgi:transcriptional regulator with XRE-family HTH domain